MVFHPLLVSCPNCQGIKSYGLWKFMPQGEIIGHFQKASFSSSILRNLMDSNEKTQNYNIVEIFQRFPNCTHRPPNSKSWAQIEGVKLRLFFVNSCTPCNLQILDNLICGLLFHFILRPQLICYVLRPIMPMFELHMGKCKGNSWFCKSGMKMPNHQHLLNTKI